MLVGRTAIINDEIKYQKLSDHINGVKDRVKTYNKVENFSNLLILISILHDAGKALPSWQENILNSPNSLPSHSRVGMVLGDRLFQSYKNEYPIDIRDYGIKDIIEYVVGSHHGLFDCLTLDGEEHKIDKKINSELENPELEKGIENYLEELGISFDGLYNLYENAMFEAKKSISKINSQTDLFDLGFIGRVFLSMLEDGDWSDAAAFTYSLENDYDRELEDFSFKTFRDNLENYIEENFTSDTSLNEIRSKISDECKESGSRPTGIYKLSVPTGAGKTIAAMRFALHHAVNWNKDRIFYFAPFISILEQNAESYRELLTTSKDEEKFILEYHSNLINNEEGDEWESELQKYLGETLSAPIILTTLVQLLNMLFSDNKQSLRKLHRLQNSVVIIDEIQSVPIQILTLLHLCINALNKYFNTTFVICSATIPEVEESKINDNKIVEINYDEDPFLTSDYNISEPFKRVKVNSLLDMGVLDEVDCGDLIEEILEKRKSILFIVNTRKAAKKIFEELEERNLNIPIYHLSNNMCPAHRLEVLEKIRSHNIDEPHIIISTALIEAGVDLSVGAVIRSITKLDSILQAMGRCNRHNELDEKGLAYIVRLSEELEKTDGLFEVHRGKEISLSKLRLFFNNPERFGGEISSVEFLKSYFKDYYNDIGSLTHYPFKEKGVETSGVLILTENRKAKESYKLINKESPKHILNQGFLTFGKNFKAIADDGIGIIIPYKEGEEYIAELISDIDLREKYKILKKAQRYSINIYENVVEELIKLGAVDVIEDTKTLYLLDGFYDEDTGLVTEKIDMGNFIL